MEEYKRIIRELFSNPMAFIGIAYPYVLFIVVILGLFYITHLNTITENSLPVVMIDSTAISEPEIELKGPSIAAAVEREQILNPSQELLEKGKTEYTNICSSCHGESGKGDGTAGAGLNPPPRNFSDAEGWKNGRSLTSLYRTLQEGIAGGGMVAYDYLNTEVKIAILHYLRTLMTDAPELNEEEVDKLDQMYAVTEGKEIPGKMPISTAMELLAVDANKQMALRDSILIELQQQSDSNPGAGIFMSVTSCPVTALSVIKQNATVITDVSMFMKMAQKNIIENGFTTDILTINETDAQTLYRYCMETLEL